MSRKAAEVESTEEETVDEVSVSNDQAGKQETVAEEGEPSMSADDESVTPKDTPSREEELAQNEQQKSELQDKMLRMVAEMDNYKKRMTRERDTALKYAAENLIRDLLPSIDNLERALDHKPEGDIAAFMEGVDMTLKGLLNTLEKAGLTTISSVGEPFDPNMHEALVMEASKDVPDQCVIREFEKGYYFKDRLLRAAKVVVSKGDV